MFDAVFNILCNKLKYLEEDLMCLLMYSVIFKIVVWVLLMVSKHEKGMFKHIKFRDLDGLDGSEQFIVNTL
jgi:hypothetical protein